VTVDVIALVRQRPGPDVLLAALLAAGPQLRVGSIAEGAALQLFDEQRALVATVETPSRIRVPGEARRLLGPVEEPEPPYWWVEVRCPTLRPDAAAVALRLARSLVEQLDGVVWHTELPT
jgi:hypothetical protein